MQFELAARSRKRPEIKQDAFKGPFFDTNSDEELSETEEKTKKGRSWFKDPVCPTDDCTLSPANISDHEESRSPEPKQEKMTGLILTKKNNKMDRNSRYISALKKRSIHREMELEIVRARTLQNTKRENEEAFVTGAYKKHLEERERFEKKLAEEDAQDLMMTSGLNSRTRFKPQNSGIKSGRQASSSANLDSHYLMTGGKKNSLISESDIDSDS